MKDQLSTDCPARQMARQFISNFNRHAGVNNSEKKEQMAKDIVKPSRRAARARVDRFLDTPPPYEPPSPSTILGRFGCHYIRNDTQHCEVGDVVSCDGLISFPDQSKMEVRGKQLPQRDDQCGNEWPSFELLEFEKISIEMVFYGGGREILRYWRRTK